MDGEGNLRAADIGITWEGNETFLHVVKVVGPRSGANYVYTLPAGRRRRPKEIVYDGSHTGDT